jgi:hypothetical protein
VIGGKMKTASFNNSTKTTKTERNKTFFWAEVKTQIILILQQVSETFLFSGVAKLHQNDAAPALNLKI